MKKLVTFIIIIFYGITVFAQNDTIPKNVTDTYSQLKDFLSFQKTNPGSYSLKFTQQWNSRRYQEHFNQLLDIDKKKDFYPVLVYENRLVSQSASLRWDPQNHKWVSTQPVNSSLGGQIVSDVVGGVVEGLIRSKKYHYSAADNNRPRYTPSFLKF